MYNFYYFYFVIDSAPPLQAFVSFLGGCAAISIYQCIILGYSLWDDSVDLAVFLCHLGGGGRCS